MSTNANNQTAYTIAGNKERDNLLQMYAQIGVTDYTFTSSTGYDRVEGTFTTPAGTKYVVEAKCRQGRVNQYPDHIIEKKKYDVLAGYLEKGYTPLYVNFFADGNIIIYNLAKRITSNSIQWTVTQCKSTTAVHGKYVAKQVGYLSVDMSKGDKIITNI